jgi:hypothetical protein
MNKPVYMKYSIKSSLWRKSIFVLKHNSDGRFDFYVEDKLIDDIPKAAIPKYSNGFI